MATTNKWGVLGDSDGEEVVTGVQDAPGAGAEAKKKRKNRKKKSSADEPAAPVAAMSLVVVKGIAAGFSRAAVEAAVSAMFDDGQAYDDPDAVIAKLKGASAPAKVAAPAPVSKGSVSSAPVTKGPSPAAPVAKGPAASAPVAKPPTPRTEAPLAAVVAPPAPEPAAAAASAPAPVSPVDHAASLTKMLEDSCQLPNVGSVLEQLTVWIHKASAEDVTIFCKSQALSLLISNLARKPVKSDVENKLKGFLETVVAKEASPSSPVWPLVKSSVAAASQQLRASVPLFAELAVGADPSGLLAVDAAIVAFAQKFSASLLSFRSVVLRNLRAPESSRVASRNAAPKAAPKALSIESADPVALFQARDYLFSQAQSLFSLFSNVSGVFADGNTADGAVSSAITDEQFAAALNACVPATDADAKQKALLVRAQVQSLRAEQHSLLEPLVETTKKLDADHSKLRTRRQELLKELSAIDEQLKAMGEQKVALEKSVADVDARFKSQLAVLDSESEGIAAVVSRMEAVPALQASLSKLNDDFESAKAALKSSTRATTSAAAVISSRAEYADASLAYLKVEAKCVEFLRKRVAAAKVTAAKLQFEISRYEELGMSKVVKDVSISAAKTQGEIAEDIAAISALCQAAVATLNSIRFGPQEDLHPAELVLHYRLRSVAASLGILLPVGTDARTVDFSQVEPVDESYVWPLPPEPSLDEDALVPAMLATIGVAPESLLPIGAAKVPSPTAADANPTVAAAGGSKGKGTASAPVPSSPVVVEPAASRSPAPVVKPSAAATKATPPRKPVAAAAASPTATAVPSGTKFAWAAKRLEPAAPVSLKTIIAQETTKTEPRAADVAAVPASPIAPPSAEESAPEPSPGSGSGGSQEFVADAPAAKSCAANLEEGEINEEAASPGPTAVDGGDVLPPRARKPRARVDN